MNFINKNWHKISLFIYILTLPLSKLYAGDTTTTTTLVNPLGSSDTTITGFIQTLLKGVLQVGIPVVALAIIYCGFLFVAARGNSEKLSKAKDALLYTLIGAAILLGSWAIATLISSTVLAL